MPHQNSDIMGQISDISNNIVLLTCQKIHSYNGEIFALTTCETAICGLFISDMMAYTTTIRMDMSKPRGHKPSHFQNRVTTNESWPVSIHKKSSPRLTLSQNVDNSKWCFTNKGK